MKQTQSEEYWQYEFEVSDDDMEMLYELSLEEGVPLSIDELAMALVADRHEKEEKRLAKIAEEKGEVYQPRKSYEPGQRLLFAALSDATGQVVDVRPGDNPEYGSFDVIQVEMDDTKRMREFAASFDKQPHPLNRVETESLSPAETYQRYKSHIDGQLERKLAAHPEFISYGSRWLLEGLLAEINVGHLNIAEAMIVVTGKPMRTEGLLDEVELPEGVPDETAAFSLAYKMARDDRFANLEGEDEPLWDLMSKMHEDSSADNS